MLLFRPINGEVLRFGRGTYYPLTLAAAATNALLPLILPLFGAKILSVFITAYLQIICRMICGLIFPQDTQRAY